MPERGGGSLLRAAALILLAAFFASAGAWLVQLDWRIGPAAQRVNIRWVPEIAADAPARARAEDALGLTAGQSAGQRTWRYRLADRSPQGIQRIFSHPSVEDTHYLDADRLRVTLDERQLSPWLQEILETEWARPVGLLLLCAALVLLWVVRRPIMTAWGALLRMATVAYQQLRLAGNRSGARVRSVFIAQSRPDLPPQAFELRRADGVAGALIGLALLVPLLMYGPTDAEEAGLGQFSGQIFYRAIFTGQSPFWLNGLGFGTPMPIGQRLDFHPAFAVASLWSLWAAVVAVWVVHVALMVVYFLRLAAASGIRPPLRTILLACYVFSLPSACYFYQTDWLSVTVGWSLLPVLVYYLRRAALEPGREAFWITATRLGLLGAFWILNAHPGYVSTMSVVLAVYVLAAAPPTFRLYACLLVAAILAAGSAAERIWFTLTEMRQFPDYLPRTMQEGFSLTQHVRAALVPLTGERTDPRGPFVGIVAALAALTMALNAVREKDGHVRAAAIAFTAAAALTFVSVEAAEPLRAFSAIWQFRDPMVLFALVAGGVALQRAADSFRPGWRAAVWCCVLLQVVQQGFAVWPSTRNVIGQAPGGYMQFYRHQHQAAGIGAAIVQGAAAYGPRLYVSRQVNDLMLGQLVADGLHFSTDLVFLGVHPVNGLFKNVSMDTVYPSIGIMRSTIEGQRDVIDNGALLDVLGVNLVMMTAAEGTPPATLRPVDRLRTHREGAGGFPHDLVLLANTDAWPRAALLDSNAQALDLPFRDGCPHRGAMCRDYTALMASRLPDSVRLDEADGRYSTTFSPSAGERLLFVSALHRPEWVATSEAGPLRIVPVAGAFVGVIVPRGVTGVELRFLPRVRMALSWLGAGVLAILLVGVGWDGVRRVRSWRSPA